MAERIVDSGFSDGVGTATFFLADQYVVYDYLPDRARDGVHALPAFPPDAGTVMPDGFGGTGPGGLVDAALRGKGSYAGFTYLFSAGGYVRHTAAGFDPAVIRPAAENWNLDASFGDPDAAWNGTGNREPYCYFFRGGQYVRYLWEEDRVDDGYPKPISNMIGIDPEFQGGVDAAVDGAGPFDGTGYLFRGDRYLRFRWVTSGEPHGDGTNTIQDGWPGLMELLLAGKAKSHALVWLAEARNRIMAQQSGSIDPLDAAVLADALNAHFRTTLADAASLTTIDAMLEKVESTLIDSAQTFRFRDQADAAADSAVGTDGVPFAAYVSPLAPKMLNFTTAFPGRPELNRVSVMIHEAVHVHDPESGKPENHISEWYVTRPTAAALGLDFVDDMDAFATRYDLMSTAASLHNPSSYATFARHIHFGTDSRENI